MQFRRLFRNREKDYVTIKVSTPSVPQGLVRKCKYCQSALFAEDVKNHHYICPKCGGYFRMHAMRRVELLTEKGSFTPWFEGLATTNPLDINGYEGKVAALKEKTGLDEAVVTGKAIVGTYEVALGVMDGRFLMASMGEVVGEKITRMVERATKEKLPVVIVACSGGARMQEGIVSLMQMAKTSAALKRHRDSGNLYISILTDPTTGGVTASFAMLGDIILAEPQALIGFAGPRVIEQTIGQKLPKGFQRSEFLLEHGFIDAIVPRDEMKDTLVQILKLHQTPETTSKENALDGEGQKKCEEEVSQAFANADASARSNPSPTSSVPAWDRVEASRRNDRPVGDDYLKELFDDFIEFHGDRYAGDDAAIIGGIATFHARPVTVIAQVKGHTTKENVKRNFGMPSPAGYRKALRLMKEAERFGRPIICFVDTPGAFCGIEAEENGQGEAIARNLFEMSALKVPIVSIVIGEGGSGGALAMAVANEVWMMENAIYSILSPEGYASILWKDSKRAKEASEVMKITASDLKRLGIVEQVFVEPEEYTVDKMTQVIRRMDGRLTKFFREMDAMTTEEIVNQRYERFRGM